MTSDVDFVLLHAKWIKRSVALGLPGFDYLYAFQWRNLRFVFYNFTIVAQIEKGSNTKGTELLSTVFGDA